MFKKKYTFFYFFMYTINVQKLKGAYKIMKNKYLLDFQDYYSALGFNFTIQYFSNDTFKLKVENEDGEIKTIYEDVNDNASAHIIDIKIKDFLLDYVQEKLLPYDDLNIKRYYAPWNGFVIAGIIFNIDDYKNDYNLFLKSVLRFVELIH